MINVIKRERKLKNSIALYLDYRINGQRIQEPTGLHIYEVKNERTKQLNKENLIRFEKLRTERQNQLLNNLVPLPIDRKKVDFFKYYEDYHVKFPTKERRADAVLKKLKKFYDKPTLPVAIIDESFLVRFKTHLEGTLSGETPHNYFKLLCKVIKFATKEQYFSINPAEDIRMKRRDGIPKNVLTIDELKILNSSSCSNNEVKIAFLFSCFTGLRYCDIANLKWKHINNDKLVLIQAKTGYIVNVDLHSNAKGFLPNIGNTEENVFQLPTTLNGCNKTLKNWVYSAGIDKKITWHCARHTFGTNLILHGADIVSTSSLMGQRSIKYTQRYIKLADSMKRQAIQLLPNL